MKIKTITAHNAAEFDKAVNAFERNCGYPTGVTRVAFTQTHIEQREGMPPLFAAVIFYNGEEIHEEAA